MVEVGVLHAAARRSKIGFWTVGLLSGLFTGVIAAGFTHVFKAVLIGLLTGAVAGFIAALILFCWPAIRVAWHWSAELLLLTFFLTTYLSLLRVMAPWLALTLLVLALLAPILVPPVRRRMVALWWCMVSRHRLRLCFAAFVASRRTGLTPLILFARPIPAGERVWVWLRPGLALSDLEARLDRLAAGCWAAECRVAPASRRYAALITIDIARRNPLNTTLGSPLTGLLPTLRPGVVPVSPAVVGGMDLPDVPDLSVSMESKRPAKAINAAEKPLTVADIITARRGDDDLTDWI
jgi:hypothetical protein